MTDARTTISEMTEITDRTLAETFDRRAAASQLFRDVPSAFWLDPEGDDALPATFGPALPAAPGPSEPEPAHVLGRRVAGLAAVLAAGPIFLASVLALQASEAGEGLPTMAGRAFVSLLAAPLSIPFGAFLAGVPVAAGIALLGFLGERHRRARRKRAWLGTGALMGAGIAGLFTATGAVALALIATSVACAGLARYNVDWVDPA